MSVDRVKICCRLNCPFGKLNETDTGAWFDGNAVSWLTLKYDTQSISSSDTIHRSNSDIHLFRNVC